MVVGTINTVAMTVLVMSLRESSILSVCVVLVCLTSLGRVRIDVDGL